MTNLQAKEPLPPLQAFLTRERILWGVPALFGGLLSLGTLALLVWPSWQKLQNDRAQLDQLTNLSNQIPQLRLKLDRSQVRYGTSQRLQASLLSLIAGSGDISTFMAQIGVEASRSGVLLESYEPNQVAPVAQPGASSAPPAPPPPAAGQPPAPPDPLLAPGLQKTDLLITAHGSAPNLLTFLRRLEALSLLVVQSDLSLKQQSGGPPAGSGSLATSSATLKLKLTLYSKQAPPTPPTPPTPARS